MGAAAPLRGRCAAASALLDRGPAAARWGATWTPRPRAGSGDAPRADGGRLRRSLPSPLTQNGAIEGVKAAAVDAGGPNVALALFVNAGSANETPETAGASKLLEYMAFSATNNR